MSQFHTINRPSTMSSISSPSSKSSSSQGSSSRDVVSRGRFFLVAFSFLLLRISLPTTLGLTGWFFLKFETASSIILYALGVSLAVLILSGIHVIANGRRVICPLCRASLFMSSRNLMKPNVPKILGCKKTPLALSLLTMPKVMNCPCCAEKVRLVRQINK